MNLSLDEYRALVAKAFRGVGYQWGLTEDAAWAARRLAEFHTASPTMVLSLLDRMDGSPVLDHMPDADWSCRSGELCPIAVGTAVSDTGGCEELALDGVYAAPLIAPFLLELVHSGHASGYSISSDDGSCAITPSGIIWHGWESMSASEIVIRRTGLPAVEQGIVQTAQRVELDAKEMQRFEAYAHRVYAPATEASRQGAGAGTTDND